MRDKSITQSRVRKTNSLNQAKFRLSATEYRMLLFCATQIKPMTDEVPTTFRIYAKDYAEAFGIDESNAYGHIRDGLDATWDAEFFEWIPNGKDKEPGWRRRRFVISQEYHPSKGYGEIELHRDFLQHLVNLKKEYTDYAVRNLQSLRSFNTMRLYEMLIQFHTVGQRYFDLIWFREVLSLEDKYPRWTDLHKHVIAPALKQITEQTDIEVIKTEKGKWIHVDKRGNQIRGFEVRFRYKAQQTLDLDEPEAVQSGVINEHDWQAQGYATEREMHEARALGEKYGVTFANAKEFLRYRARLHELSSRVS